MSDLGFRLFKARGEVIQDELDFATGKLKINGVAVESGLPVPGVIATADEINKLAGLAENAGITLLQEVLFTADGAGTYTGTIALPAGARIIDIGVEGVALWDSATSASMIVGDDADADGFFTATDLKATDLLVGEINNIEHPGGKAGAYIAGEQRVLRSSAARNIIGVITADGAGSAGRTRMYVFYAVPAVVANAAKT